MCGIIISMDIEMENAAALKALGDPTRLAIVEMLACCCAPLEEAESSELPTAGEVCCSVTGARKISSTVSHHLKELRAAGLVRMSRKGKFMMCELERANLERLGGYLISLARGEKNNECC